MGVGARKVGNVGERIKDWGEREVRKRSEGRAILPRHPPHLDNPQREVQRKATMKPILSCYQFTVEVKYFVNSCSPRQED